MRDERAFSGQALPFSQMCIMPPQWIDDCYVRKRTISGNESPHSKLRGIIKELVLSIEANFGELEPKALKQNAFDEL